MTSQEKKDVERIRILAKMVSETARRICYSDDEEFVSELRDDLDRQIKRIWDVYNDKLIY